MLLLSCLSLTNCVEEATIGCLGFDIHPTITVRPEPGQGCRLEVNLTNFKGEFDEAAFVVTNYLEKKPYSDVQLKLDECIKVTDPSQFSTLVKLNSPLYRRFSAYAYIVVDGMEFRTDAKTFEIMTDIVPNPLACVDSVEVINHEISSRWYDKLSGEVIVHGAGFMPFERMNEDDYLFRSGFLQVKGVGKGFSPHFVSATEAELRLSYEADDFGTYAIEFTQGGNSITLPGIEVPYPNYILSPERPLRAYEPFIPTYANDLYTDNLTLYVKDLIHSYSWEHQSVPCRFTPSQSAYDVEQHLSGHGNMPLVHLEFDAPWQRVGSLGRSLDTGGTFCLGGEMWWREGEVLYRFDPQILTAEEIAMPDFSNFYVGRTFGMADDGSLLLRVSEMVAWEHKAWLYRYSFETRKWTLLEKLWNTTDSFLFVWQEGDMLYEIRNKQQLWVTDLSDEEGEPSISTLHNLPAAYNTHFIYKDGDTLLGYSGGNGSFFSYSLATDVTTWYAMTSLQELSLYHRWNLELSYAPVVRRGDWLYYHRQPLMRVNMADDGATKEYLGAPLGHNEQMYLLPYDDQVLSIDYETGDIYRFTN